MVAFRARAGCANTTCAPLRPGRCRLAALGGHIDACTECGAMQHPVITLAATAIAPKCGGLQPELWMDPEDSSR